MRDVFSQQLDELRQQLGALAGAAVQAHEFATRALLEDDLFAAEEALSLDEAIEPVHEKCGELAVRILALQGPVAADLRLVFSAVRISGDMMRMAQLVQSIARLVRRRGRGDWIPDRSRDAVVKMSELSAEIGRRVHGAFTAPDVEALSEIASIADELESVHSGLLRSFDDPVWDAGDVPTAVDLALIARYYGRFGDQGASVSERIIFFLTGTRPSTAV